MSNPIDQGVFPSGDVYYWYDYSRDTNGYGDDFGGLNEDVFYKFTVGGDTEINVDLFGHGGSSGQVWLLDENSNVIDFSDGNNGTSLTAEINTSIPAGTYYLVLEAWVWYAVDMYYYLDVLLTVS